MSASALCQRPSVAPQVADLHRPVRPFVAVLVESDVLELEHHGDLAMDAVGEPARLLRRHTRHLADREVAAGPAVEDAAVHLGQVLVDLRAVGEVRHAVAVAGPVTGPSGNAGSFEMKLMTSMRKPSIPRSSHQFIIAKTASRTSALSQLRSGCLRGEQMQVVLRRVPDPLPRRSREHRSPVVRFGSRLAADGAGPCVAPEVPVGLGLESRARRESTNHGCSSEVWLTTRSMISLMPRAVRGAG